MGSINLLLIVIGILAVGLGIALYQREQWKDKFTEERDKVELLQERNAYMMEKLRTLERTINGGENG
jgi:uncharacterized membrane protein YidH (DUF202 family)